MTRASGEKCARRLACERDEVQRARGGTPTADLYAATHSPDTATTRRGGRLQRFRCSPSAKGVSDEDASSTHTDAGVCDRGVGARGHVDAAAATADRGRPQG